MLRIVDVSANNGDRLWWPDVAKAGIDGAFCKVSEGAGWADPTAPRNAAGIRAAGLVRGYYAFARPDLGNTPRQEALYFLAHIPDLAPGDLLALDLEVPTSGPGAYDSFALTWLQTVQERAGVRPLLYTGRWYAQGLGRLGDPQLAGYGLWDAAYAPEQPLPYAPWSQTTLWQHTNARALPGIGLCDESYYGGSRAQLLALGVPDTGKTPAAAAPAQHWMLDVAMHLRPRPLAEAVPLGPLLPAGTVVVEVDPPGLGTREVKGWAYVRTSGDVHGWLLISNMHKVNG